MPEIVDVMLRVLGAVGAPAIILFWLKDRRRINNEASLAEAEQPYEVRATAATTLDAEVAALQKAFDLDRKTRNQTIEDLRADLQAARQELDAKDEKIEELKKQVRRLQEKLDSMQREMTKLQEEFTAVSIQLDNMHKA